MEKNTQTLKFPLYFIDKYNRQREVAMVKNMPEAASAVAAFLKQYNYKSYYTRNWIQEHEDFSDIMFDVGSHTEFFAVRCNNYDVACMFLKGVL